MTTQQDLMEGFQQMEQNYRSSIVKLSGKLSLTNLIAALRAEIAEYDSALMSPHVSANHPVSGLIGLQVLCNQFTIRQLADWQHIITHDTPWTPELSSIMYSTGYDIQERAREAYFNDQTMKGTINKLEDNLKTFKDNLPDTEYIAPIIS